MTIPEAVQLVLQAAALGRGGEVFVLDMGEPVRIVDLARDLIRLSGLEPDRDIEIRFTGLRPGEKLFEELFGADEAYGRTRHEKIFVYRNGHADGAAGALADPGPAALDASRLAGQIDALILAAQQGDAAEVRCRLGELVPEYSAGRRTGDRGAGGRGRGSKGHARPSGDVPRGSFHSSTRSATPAPDAIADWLAADGLDTSGADWLQAQGLAAFTFHRLRESRRLGPAADRCATRPARRILCGRRHQRWCSARRQRRCSAPSTTRGSRPC